MMFKCHECGKPGYVTRSDLATHKRISHPRPDRHYFAPECPRNDFDSPMRSTPQKRPFTIDTTIKRRRKFVPQKVTRLDLEEMLENLMMEVGQVIMTHTEFHNLRQAHQTIKRRLS